MIVTFLVQLVLGIVSALFSLLPSWSVDTSAVTSTSGSWGFFLGAFDDYLPERTLVACLGILVAIKVFMSLWHLLVFIYRSMPGKAT